MHFIMAETDRNLMAPVRGGSLLAVWSGVMPTRRYEGNMFFFYSKDVS
jgi:hypothetical protein